MFDTPASTNHLDSLSLALKLANMFRLSDEEPQKIVTAPGDDFIRAKAAFAFLFKQTSEREYKEIAKAVWKRRQDTSNIMPKYGDLSTETLLRLDRKIDFLDLCVSITEVRLDMMNIHDLATARPVTLDLKN